MADEDRIPDLVEASERIERMRIEIHQEVNRLFAILLDQAEGDRMEGLVKLATTFQEQRDAARADVEALKEELRAAKAEIRRSRDSGVAKQHVDMLNLATAARKLAESIRHQVNRPTSSRDELQGATLRALQAWDETGGRYVS